MAFNNQQRHRRVADVGWGQNEQDRARLRSAAMMRQFVRTFTHFSQRFRDARPYACKARD
jgi:hypothetical protein